MCGLRMPIRESTENTCRVPGTLAVYARGACPRLVRASILLLEKGTSAIGSSNTFNEPGGGGVGASGVCEFGWRV